MSKREVVASSMQGAGVVAAVAAGWVGLGVAAGLAVLSVGLIVFGLAVERRV